MDFEKWQADSVAMSVDFYGPFIHDWENKIFVVEHSGNAACQIHPRSLLCYPGFNLDRLGEPVGIYRVYNCTPDELYRNFVRPQKH